VIDPTQAGNAVPPGYIGFSHEWGQAQLLMGDPAIGTNPIYRQLLDNLTAYGGGPISIRVGGNSTDTTALPDASTVRPFAQLFEDLSSPTKPNSWSKPPSILGISLAQLVKAGTLVYAKREFLNHNKYSAAEGGDSKVCSLALRFGRGRRCRRTDLRALATCLYLSAKFE
jgi:hypothetical protein